MIRRDYIYPCFALSMSPSHSFPPYLFLPLSLPPSLSDLSPSLPSLSLSLSLSLYRLL